MTLEEYVTLLFSRLDDTQIQHTVNLYSNISGVEGVVSQAGAVMGESELLLIHPYKLGRSDTCLPSADVFICPTYWALQAFGTKAWKVREAAISGCSRITHSCDVQGEFAVPPALHASDLPYYFGT